MIKSIYLAQFNETPNPLLNHPPHEEIISGVSVVSGVSITELSKDSNSGHFANIISSIASIGQVPRAIASSISSTLRSRPSTSPTPSPINFPAPPPTIINDDLAGFRERMLATNSANDLMIRDINPLLEDYKNLLFIVLKL